MISKTSQVTLYEVEISQITLHSAEKISEPVWSGSLGEFMSDNDMCDGTVEGFGGRAVPCTNIDHVDHYHAESMEMLASLEEQGEYQMGGGAGGVWLLKVVNIVEDRDDRSDDAVCKGCGKGYERPYFEGSIYDGGMCPECWQQIFPAPEDT